MPTTQCLGDADTPFPPTWSGFCSGVQNRYTHTLIFNQNVIGFGTRYVKLLPSWNQNIAGCPRTEVDP